MNTVYDTVEVAGLTLSHRPGTTDIRVIHEVITNRCYRRAKVGFDVEAGEKWLDLGANIGAFAAYAHSRGARCESFEPEPGCFAVLKVNRQPGCNIFRAAVTSHDGPTIPFFAQKDKARQATASTLSHRSRNRMEAVGEVANVCAADLPRYYNGVKMDIEGAEHDIIDRGMIPACDKLVLEYHSTVDRSVANMARRVEVLRSLFDNVYLEPEMERAIASGALEYRPFFDRQIFAWGRK